MLRRLHPLAGGIAMSLILIFWLSTAYSELFASLQTVACVKRTILWSLPALVLALMLTGASGFRMAAVLANDRSLDKIRRMKIVAFNGVVFLLPSAFFLDRMASQARFDGLFYALQGIELAAGAANLVLMGLNLRDGLRMSGRL